MNTANIDIARVVENARIRPIHLTVFLISVVMSLVDGYDTMTLTYASIAIAQEWQISVSQFAPTFTATLLGMASGGFIFGHLGDRYGRKMMFLAASATFGIFTLITPLSMTAMQLIVLRFFVGLGIGGFMPNATALVTDYMPARFQRSAVMIIVGCLAGGGLLGGVGAHLLLPTFGWKSLFYVGGLSALLMVAIAWIVLPESMSYLMSRPDKRSLERAKRILERIDPSSGFTANQLYHINQNVKSKSLLTALFRDQRAFITLLIWIALSLDMIVFYVFALWLPALTKENGASASIAYSTTALFSLGGLIGSIILGPVSHRIGEHRTIVLCFVTVIATCVVLSQPHVNPNILFTAAFVAGVSAFGVYPAMIALVANYYPPEIRSTAIGYCSGISRGAAMLSPVAVGALFQNGFTPREILLAPIFPTLLAAMSVTLIYALRKKHGEIL